MKYHFAHRKHRYELVDELKTIQQNLSVKVIMDCRAISAH